MPTLIEKSLHYNGEVEIHFYPNSHRYKVAGQKDYLIGVTTACGIVDKSGALIPWAVKLATDRLLEIIEIEGRNIEPIDIINASTLHKEKKEQAAAKGKLVHEWAEKWIKGENPEIPEDEQVRNGAIAFLDWVKKNDIRFISSEKRVYSRKHGYVGTMDTSFTMGSEGHKIIHPGDFKTSSGIYFEMAMQVSAYQAAESEENGTVYGSKCIVRFDKETAEFQVKWFQPEEHLGHFRAFLACLEVKRQLKIWDKIHNEYYKRNPQKQEA